MAEGFARRYGSDVMQIASAGLAPAPIIQPLTYKVMVEKNIALEGQYPKDLLTLHGQPFDVVINMSRFKLPTKMALDMREWDIPDPIGQSEETYVAVRDDIEMRVMKLIIELRRPALKKLRPDN